MAPDIAPLPDVYSANELARAAGVPTPQVRALIRQATIPTIDGALVTLGDAVNACRALHDGRLVAPPPPAEREGSRTTSSPLPRRTPAALAPPRAQPRPTPPPPLVREPLPELLGPAAAVGANPRDVSGLLGRVVAPHEPIDNSRSAGT
jgi:hypothetical protein